MPNTHLTPAGILFACLVAWWILASAAARTIEVCRALRNFLRGE